jgi:hypothetical protein
MSIALARTGTNLARASLLSDLTRALQSPVVMSIVSWRRKMAPEFWSMAQKYALLTDSTTPLAIVLMQAASRRPSRLSWEAMTKVFTWLWVKDSHDTSKVCGST